MAHAKFMAYALLCMQCLKFTLSNAGEIHFIMETVLLKFVKIEAT